MKKVVNYIILIGLIGLTIWILIRKNDISNFTLLISQTNKLYLVLAFLSMVLFWILDAAIIHKMKKVLKIEGSFWSSVKLAMIGQYYSAITPFATGGQPAQVYSLVSDRVTNVGTASSLLIAKLLIYQIVVSFYSVFMFLGKFNFLLDNAKFSFPFVIIGCLANFFVALIIIGLFYNENLIRKLFDGLLILANKFNLIKDLNKSKYKLNTHILDYKAGFNILKKDKVSTFILVVVTFIQITFYFSMTYFVYLAVKLPGTHYLDIIAVQSLHYMAVSFMPTPGTVGAAEGGFYMLYNSFVPKSILTFVIVLWRFIDYYFAVIVGGIVTLVDFICQRNKRRIKYKSIM